MSLTLTIPQHKTLQKLASYFKVSQAKLREYLDEHSAERGVLHFGGDIEERYPNFTFNDDLYCSAGKFNLAHLWDQKKFLKSDFYQKLLEYQTEGAAKHWAYCTGGSILILKFGSTSFSEENAFIWVGDDVCDIPTGLTIQPIANYLRVHYPQAVD
jgi:hypothetical protein